jgi:predicted metalloendopeptidase
LSKLCTESSVSTDKSVNTEEAVNKRSKLTDKSVSPATDTSVSSARKQSNTVIKCFSRTRLKHPLETYITLYKSKGILVDWWEEGEDKICFELNTHSLVAERNVYK